MHFDDRAKTIVGDHGTPAVLEHDEVSRKLAMNPGPPSKYA